jgi:hypothetical protein
MKGESIGKNNRSSYYTLIKNSIYLVISLLFLKPFNGCPIISDKGPELICLKSHWDYKRSYFNE